MYVINYEEKSKSKVQDGIVKRDISITSGTYPCLKQLKIGLRCCSTVNSVMVGMDVYQNIVVQGTLNFRDNVS